MGIDVACMLYAVTRMQTIDDLVVDAAVVPLCLQGWMILTENRMVKAGSVCQGQLREGVRNEP
jgi:hypothetical protein